MNEVVKYQNAENQTQVDFRFEGETLWLSLNQIAELFARDKSVISRHLKNIYREGQLDAAATVAKNATIQMESERAVNRSIEFYNLDAILSVGYSVNSKRET